MTRNHRKRNGYQNKPAPVPHAAPPPAQLVPSDDDACQHGHRHHKTYCHLTYRCEAGHEFSAWNSRDGVVLSLALCRAPDCEKAAQLVPGSARYDPDYQPRAGDYLIRDATAEEAESVCREAITLYPPAPALLANMGFASLEDLVQDMAGHPDVVASWPLLARVSELEKILP